MVRRMLPAAEYLDVTTPVGWLILGIIAVMRVYSTVCFLSELHAINTKFISRKNAGPQRKQNYLILFIPFINVR